MPEKFWGWGYKRILQFREKICPGSPQLFGRGRSFNTGLKPFNPMLALLLSFVDLFCHFNRHHYQGITRYTEISPYLLRSHKIF